MINRLWHTIIFTMMLLSSTGTIGQLAMPDSVCVGTNKTYRVNDPLVLSTYTWQIDGVLQTATQNQISVTWNTPGIFLLEVQEHGSGGCDGIVVSGLVNVYAKPTAVISGGGVICRGLSKALAINLSGRAPWMVAYSDGTSIFTIPTITASPYQLVVSPTVNTTYTLISVTDANCTNTANGSTAISVGTPITAVRYTTINATSGVPKNLFPPGARVFTSFDQYFWTPNFGLNTYYIPTPVFNPNKNYNNTTDYFITINAGTGCTVVDTLLVNVVPASASSVIASAIFIPKAFSPNNNGHNDKLTPLLFRIRQLYYFRVFNRWGQMVFETGMQGEGWDGNFRKIPAEAGVYTWTAAGVGTDGRTHNVRGQTILLR